MASRVEIAQAVTMLASAAQVEADEPLLEAYAIALKNIPGHVLKRAVVSAIKEGGSFLVKPGEFLAICRHENRIEIRAAIAAWEEYKNFGRGNELAMQIAADMGCKPHTPEWYTKGRQYFIGRYSHSIRRSGGRLEQAVRALPGRTTNLNDGSHHD